MTKNFGDFERAGADFVPFLTFPGKIYRFEWIKFYLPISPRVMVALVLISLSPFLVTKTRLSDCFDFRSRFSDVSPKSPLFRFEPVLTSVASVEPFDLTVMERVNPVPENKPPLEPPPELA